ncbi:MAG TPA: acetyl ornithine aminotransferase family protein [Thermoplasmata archaeon]|nr:acetyl ornithine aminotransferase family protein [Thermoplasmata archaeon]
MSQSTPAPMPASPLPAGSSSKRGVRIVTPIPGPKASEMIAEDTRLLMTSTKSAPIAVESARGVWLHDVDGNTLLDFTSGVGVLNVGHCHPAVVRAVQQQAERLMHFAGTDYYYDVQVKVAERLTEITPGTFGKKVFFTNSGTESIEAAVKLARWQRQKPITIGLLGAFHGRSMGALTLTSSKTTQRERFGAFVGGGHHIPSPYCYRCPYQLTYPSCDLYCAKILKELYFETSIPPEDVAAFVAEPVLGEGGYIVPPPGWHKAIKRILDEHHILFISDEVQAGIGRTGKWFGVEHHGVVPDILASAKALGGGLPMGAIVFRSELDYPGQGHHSNTFGGNLIAGAAALASLDVMEKEHLLDNARKGGDHLMARLRELQAKHPQIGDVRGLGLMTAIEIIAGAGDKSPAPELRDQIIDEAWKRGLVMLPCGKSSIRQIPPLVITTDELDEGVEILDAAIGAAVRAG